LAARIINIILAGFVFFSATGFVVNKHFCQDELRHVKLFMKGEGCHEIMKKCGNEDALPMKGMSKSAPYDILS